MSGACVCVCVLYTYHSTHMEVRGQFVEVCCLLPPDKTWELNSGYQSWQQVPLLTETSQHLTHMCYFLDKETVISK